MFSKEELQNRQNISPCKKNPPGRPRQTYHTSLKNLSIESKFDFNTPIGRGNLPSNDETVTEGAPWREYSKDDSKVEEVYDVCDSEYVLPNYKTSLGDIHSFKDHPWNRSFFLDKPYITEKLAPNPPDPYHNTPSSPRMSLPMKTPSHFRTSTDSSLSLLKSSTIKKTMEQGTQTPPMHVTLKPSKNKMYGIPEGQIQPQETLDMDTFKSSRYQKNRKVTFSFDIDPPKHLENLFSREWMEDIGDGIKRKMSVMSELMKSFKDDKFLFFDKKLRKTRPFISHRLLGNQYDNA